MTPLILAVCVVFLLIMSLGAMLHWSILRSIRIARTGGCLTVIKAGLPRYVKISESVRLLDRLPAHLILQLILHEDDRFFVHGGFNVPEVVRSLRATIKNRRLKGGSSITQQLARTIFCAVPGRSSSPLRRKMKEVLVTFYLERYLSKREILALYFDHVAFWNKAIGIREAAIFLFKKIPERLTVPEGEILVSLITGAYVRLDFSESPWEEQVFDLHLSYEKLLALQRWFVSTFPERNFSILESLPLSYAELSEVLMQEAPLNQELDADRELQFQLNNAQALTIIAAQLPHIPPSFEVSHRYLPTPLSVITNLMAVSREGEVNDFQQYLFSHIDERCSVEIYSLIQKHIVAGLIFATSKISSFPPGFLFRLQELQAIELAQHLRVKSAFVALQKLLNARVEVINVKGIDLHERFYGDLHVRSATDIDILVAEDAYAVIVRCLREAGYQKQMNTSDKRDLLVARWTGETVVWIDPQLRVPIDIHVLPASRYAELYKHSERIEMREPYSDIIYRGLGKIELLEYLCQHAAKHGWCRIQWLADIDRVARTVAKEELSIIVSKERQSQCDLNTLLGFFLVKHILLRPHRVGFSVAHSHSRTIHALAHIVIAHTMVSPTNSFVGWTKIRYLWLSNRGIFKKCSCILSFLFTPTRQDLPAYDKDILWYHVALAGFMRPILGAIRVFYR
jgi:hypothetical protein